MDRADNPAHTGPERRAMTVAELLEEARKGSHACPRKRRMKPPSTARR
jgi:hypothetical protein